MSRLDTPMKRNWKGYRIGGWHQNARLDEAKVGIVRRDYVPHVRGYGYFAKLFDVSWEAIRDVVKFNTWSHVEAAPALNPIGDQQ